MARSSKHRAEFGDFQTPAPLARQVCALAHQRLGVPRTILEPTCGEGSLLVASFERFGAGPNLVGLELDPGYVERARTALAEAGSTAHTLVQQDFFAIDWSALLDRCSAPLLVVGNPPWVTSAAQGAREATNLPPKSNFQGRRGLDAITGASNFDISEWMCIRLLEQLAGRDAALALLLKTTVARKVLAHAWAEGLALQDPAIFGIDARRHFGAAVDAGLLVGRTHARGEPRCPVHASLDDPRTTGVIGYDDGVLVADIDARRDTAHLRVAEDEGPPWRSGIKHDCARVLELREVDGRRLNGLGEPVDVEDEALFPLLKGSDVARGRTHPARWLVVTQHTVGASTERLRTQAPRTWAYLLRHAARLDGRKSSIYRGRPRFSMFGVGPYAFTPWKVAICGLYKQLEFRVIGPDPGGRPVVFDDTVYFLPCADRAHARRVHGLLRSELARRFYASFIFWDAKRPVTARVLRRLSLDHLARALRVG